MVAKKIRSSLNILKRVFRELMINLRGLVEKKFEKRFGNKEKFFLSLHPANEVNEFEGKSKSS